jgi:hypothetical protein
MTKFYSRDSQTFQLAYHYMWFNTFIVRITNNYCMCSHTVLSAILPPFLCTAVIRKIIVAIFVKNYDMFTAWTNRLFAWKWCVCVCVCVCVCLGSNLFFLVFLLFYFFLLSVYHWTVAGVPLVVDVPQFEKHCSREYCSFSTYFFSTSFKCFHADTHSSFVTLKCLWPLFPGLLAWMSHSLQQRSFLQEPTSFFCWGKLQIVGRQP